MSRRETAWFSTLLLVAAALYLWNLPLNGWGNSYYAAAAQAGASNWTAFFFGSSDGGNGITVDKLPGSIWVASLSVRLFGLSSWSLLLPQALMGIGTVALTYLIVRQHFKASTALLSGVILLLTPAAAIMFRYNNPDALLTFLLTLAVYLILRAAEDGRWRWILLAAVAIGIGIPNEIGASPPVIADTRARVFVCWPRPHEQAHRPASNGIFGGHTCRWLLGCNRRKHTSR